MTGGPDRSADDVLDVVALTQTIVRTPSPNPPGDEQAVAAAVTELLPALGLPAAQVVALDAARPNLLVVLDFGGGGRHLVLSGHLDTKPVGDAAWTVDPLGGDIDGDRLYGLGAADMKGAVAAMLVTAARLARDPLPHGRLTLLFTADEEDGASFGARHVARSRPLGADAVVIGEPGGIEADFDRLHLVSRGIARLRLSARGRQGHSSLSGEPGTRNAGVDVARLVTAVADELALDVPANPDGLAGWAATVNTGMTYRGGVGYGVLPGRMAVDTEVRLLPGMDRAAVTAAFTDLTGRVASETGADLAVEYDAAPNDWLPPAAVPAGHSVARAAQEACAAVLGTVPPFAVFPGTTDATWFEAEQGVPTLPALGPGLLRRAHGADEWVSVTAVRRSVELYEELARRFCTMAGPSAENGRS
ncbi:M20 family metallopeptidase [Geodermatophilus sabuli]|uniref:Succinyl-diaminopimelate desuccinylase n=1 Tax=Geodermatophilus sabuli TaxID=1564158 RepID=A0A285ECZ0_9ACTN|nr:M20 family metallopeptidase [Geodermatophilus sabuli]MBB3083566.1 acetylornithine deacetylase/succinyl-diaminopimelate desuccinylase-like protein [Geodermatophilus sabuli]SNX96713.1 succinyl-diaminopimelate desuccinylase [Geodermatophilus sabuli]